MNTVPTIVKLKAIVGKPTSIKIQVDSLNYKPQFFFLSWLNKETVTPEVSNTMCS